MTDAERPLLGDGTRAAPRLLVEAWLVRRRESGWQVLLLQRRGSRGGFWQGISGKVETGDTDLEAAARREITEEIGLREPERPLAPLPPEQVFEGLDDVWYRKRSFVAVAPADLVIQLSEEHVDHAWLSLPAARERVEIPAYRDELTRVEEVLRSWRHGVV